jgi:hypothetical protein
VRFLPFVLAAVLVGGCTILPLPGPVLPPPVEPPPVEWPPPIGDAAYDQLTEGMSVAEVSAALGREPDDMPAEPVAGEVTRRWTGVEVKGAPHLVFVVFTAGRAVRKGAVPIVNTEGP